MAITFDNDIVSIGGLDYIDRIVYGRKILGTEEASYNKVKHFKLFEDHSDVGDCLYFGWFNGVWHDLTLDIEHPLMADNIHIEWEYWNGNWNGLPVVDNTANFMLAGQNTIEFDVPNDMRDTFVDGKKAYWIRARILLLNNLHNGGHHADVYPTGKDYSVMVTGATGNTPQAIYTSGVAGGAMTKIGELYFLNCNLRIGNYSTFTKFEIKNCTLQVGENMFERNILAHRTDDEWYMDQGGLIYYGPIVEPYNYWSCRCFWNYSFYKNNNAVYYNGNFNKGEKIIQRCLIQNTVAFFFSQLEDISSIKDSIVQVPVWYVYTSQLNIDNVMTSGGILSNQPIVIKNIDFGSSGTFNHYGAGGSLLDCRMENYGTQMISGGAASKDAYVKFTLYMRFIDEDGNDVENVNVDIKDKDSGLFDGEWTGEHVVTAITITKVGGSWVPIEHNPFTITITKKGYETIVKEFSFTDRPEHWVITLKKEEPVRIATDGACLALEPEKGSKSLLLKI